MLGTYASAALICAASLLVGRALLSVAGRRSWTWLEPALGFAAVLTVTGILARAPGHATSATIGLVLLILAALAIVLGGARYEAGDAWRQGLPVALVVVAILSIPFAISGRWGLLGVGFNNDLGLHLAWAEWLRSGLGPTPEAGYPMGPHGLAAAVAAVPGIGLGQAFVGEIVAIGVLTALTALVVLRDLSPARRLIAATMVAVPYLAASYYAQGAFKETAEALLALTTALVLADLDRRRRGGETWAELVPSPGGAIGWGLLALPLLAIAGGVFFSYSFAGLAWPLAVVGLWSLTLPEVRALLAPRSLLRLLLRPVTLIALAALAGLAALATLIGPFGFASGFNKVAGSNTYGPVSPVETLGIWWTPNYRLDAPGAAELPWLAGAIAGAALALGLFWWVRRRELAVPIGLGACALLYVGALPFSGDYSQAKALMIAAPLAMLVAVRPLLAEFGLSAGRERLAWTALAVVFVGGAAWSSFLALRDGPVGPPGHGAELRSFLPILRGEPVLYAGQDRYAAHNLMGADAHVPLVEFPDPEVSPNPEKPFDTGDAYSPLDFDSFTEGTLDRFPFVITGHAAWNSQAPSNFRRVASTPSYLLWERTGPIPPDRHVLLEGTDPAALAGCNAPEIRILLGAPGTASLFTDAVIGPKGHWRDGNVLDTGGEATQSLQLPPGRWLLSLQYFSPFDLTLTAPGLDQPLVPGLDGQRPNTISLANNGQFWPAGEVESDGGRIRFTVTAAEPSTLQSLTGYEGKAYLGNLVAVEAGPRRIVPLAQACEGWIDWYESQETP